MATIINEYAYPILERKALSADATQEDINALGMWFERFGSDFWNGEFYNVDDVHRLIPIDEEDADGDFHRIGWQLK